MTDTNDYHLTTTWRIEATRGEIADVLRDPLDLPRWWPAVYLGVEELVAAGSDGRGQRVSVRTRGWLPYTLEWEFVVVDSRYPERFTLEAAGDFVGRDTWTLEQDDRFVNVTYDWQIRAQKPLLQKLAPVMRPLLEANHRWAMEQGRESLQLELLRTRAATDIARRRVPAPPGPITYAAVGLLASVALIGGGIGYLILRQRRRARRRA